MTSPTMMAGELFAICPCAGSMPIVPSAPVFVFAFHFSPGFALRAGAASLMLERIRVVDGERNQREAQPVHQIDDAILAELRIALSRLGIERSPGDSPV